VKTPDLFLAVRHLVALGESIDELRRSILPSKDHAEPLGIFIAVEVNNIDIQSSAA
jgi:hypothetical protein